MPQIYSRADWGADERMRDCCVEYGEVHAGFVHHTVNANDYTRREVPAILRGIYAYHTQSRGWRDIGYNFLIDRFGRIWEGRYGGITMPVVGAHTLDYNENSFAASAIGNYETAQPSVRDARRLRAALRVEAEPCTASGRTRVRRSQVRRSTRSADTATRPRPPAQASTSTPRSPRSSRRPAQYQHIYAGRALQHSFISDRRPDLLMLGRGQVVVTAWHGSAWIRRPDGSSTPFGGMTRWSPVRDVTGDGLPT